MFSDLAKKTKLPLIGLRDLAPFPCDIPIFPLYIGRKESVELLDRLGVLSGCRADVILCSLKNPAAEISQVSDLYSHGMASILMGSEFCPEKNAYKVLSGGIYPVKVCGLALIDGIQTVDFKIVSEWFPVATLESYWVEISRRIQQIKNRPGNSENEVLNHWSEDYKGANLANTCFNLLSPHHFVLEDRLGLLEANSPAELLNYTLELLENRTS